MEDLSFLEDNFLQRINFAKLQIREGRVQEAMQLIDELENEFAPHIEAFGPGHRYLLHFCRGRAHVQSKQPDLARMELEIALEIAASDAEARVRTLNLLGLVMFELEQPNQALQHHLTCLSPILDGSIKDHNLQLSVYQNLANDYWAMNDMRRAIGMYKEALRVLKDLDAPDRQAEIFWGLALGYKTLDSKRYAKLYIARAINIYKTIGNRMAEAAMEINLAEILIEEDRAADAWRALDRVGELLSGTESYGLLSFMHRYSAELARQTGDIAGAIHHGEESVDHAQRLLNVGHAPDAVLWIDPVRTYVEALRGAALAYEAGGEIATADRLFEQAFERLEATSLSETKHAVHISYAAVLEARGDFKGSALHYKLAAML